MSEHNINIPKIRFPGFADAWEKRKLGEVATFINGRAYKQDELLEKGKYRVLRVGNFYTNGEWYWSDMELGEKYYAEKGDLLYTWSATFGPHIWNGEKVIYHYHIWKVELSDQLDKQFAVQLLESDKAKIMSDKNGSTMVHITKKGMEDKIVALSSVDEQRKIGEFFANIDHLITIHQRKLNHLQDEKKGLLQKMFPKNGEEFPELRFPGFTDAWEQRKLKDIVIRVIRKNKDLESILPLTISAQDGLVDQNVFFNKTVASHDVSGYYLVKNGEFAYNKSYSNGYPWGTVKRLDKYDMGVLSTLYIVFKPMDVNSDFLAKYYDTDNWHKEVSKRAAEGARNHGLLNIAASEFFETELTIPTSKEEQAQIGSFFSHLDHLITLHQRKLDHLQERKKALLQQMFV